MTMSDFDEIFVGHLEDLHRIMALAWDRTAIVSPEWGRWGTVNNQFSGDSEERFRDCHTEVQSILKEWRFTLRSPVLENVPGQPDPRVLLRMIEQELVIQAALAELEANQGRFDEAIGQLAESLRRVCLFVGPLMKQLLAAVAIAARLPVQPVVHFTDVERQIMQALFEASRPLTGSQLYSAITGARSNGRRIDGNATASLVRRQLISSGAGRGRGSSGYSLTDAGREQSRRLFADT